MSIKIDAGCYISDGNHGVRVIERTSFQQKAAFHRHLNKIVILASDLLSCIFVSHQKSTKDKHLLLAALVSA